LIVLLAFGAPSGGLIDLPISFFLKNKLHLQASELANFRLVAALPLYSSCIFGFVRDTWNPFGMGDRGYLLLFGAISGVLYTMFAFTSVTYVTLLVAMVLLTTAFLFASSAQNGMTAAIGQQHLMTGQVSAMWNIFLSIPMVGALLVGGWLSGTLEELDPDEAIRILFLAGAAVMASVSVLRSGSRKLSLMDFPPNGQGIRWTISRDCCATARSTLP
jgi:BT1 family